MEQILGWVKNIVVYLILISVILNILPNNSYKKYVRLFTGLLLVLLISRPLLQFFNLDDKLRNYYQYYGEGAGLDSGLMGLDGVEKEQKQAVLEAYRQQVKENIEREAAACGWSIEEAQITLEEQEEFGKIKEIRLFVARDEQEEDILIAPVVIGQKNMDLEDGQETEELKKRIISQYQIEEKSVLIQAAVKKY